MSYYVGISIVGLGVFRVQAFGLTVWGITGGMGFVRLKVKGLELTD